MMFALRRCFDGIWKFFCAKDTENLLQKHAKTHHVVSKNAKIKTQGNTCVFGCFYSCFI